MRFRSKELRGIRLIKQTKTQSKAAWNQITRLSLEELRDPRALNTIALPDNLETVRIGYDQTAMLAKLQQHATENPQSFTVELTVSPAQIYEILTGSPDKLTPNMARIITEGVSDGDKKIIPLSPERVGEHLSRIRSLGLQLPKGETLLTLETYAQSTQSRSISTATKEIETKDIAEIVLAATKEIDNKNIERLQCMKKTYAEMDIGKINTSIRDIAFQAVTINQLTINQDGPIPVENLQQYIRRAATQLAEHIDAESPPKLVKDLERRIRKSIWGLENLRERLHAGYRRMTVAEKISTEDNLKITIEKQKVKPKSAL